MDFDAKTEVMNDMKTNLNISENLSVLKSIYNTLNDTICMASFIIIPGSIIFATIILSICIINDEEKLYLIYPLIIGIVFMILLLLLRSLFKFLVINQKYRLRKNILLMISKKVESNEYRNELMKYKSFYICVAKRNKRNKYNELDDYEELFIEDDKWKEVWY